MKEGFNFDGSLGGHYTYDEIVIKLHELYDNYGPSARTSNGKSIINQFRVEGYSHEEKPIYVLQIGSLDKPAVFFSGLTHAREPMTMMSLMHFMFWLCENYNESSSEKNYLNRTIANVLVDNFCIWIMPICNPDGYIFNEKLHPNGGGMYRKNRNINNSENCKKVDQGVDLNRNYDINWGVSYDGSSGNPCSDFYRGTSAFSEEESRVMRDFFGHSDNKLTNDKNIKIAMHLHSPGNFIIIPKTRKGSVYSHKYNAIANEMTRFNHYKFGNSFQTVGYRTDGSAENWTNNNNKGNFVYSFIPEIGATFWPKKSHLWKIIKDTNVMFQSTIAMSSDYPIIEKFTAKFTDENSVAECTITFSNIGIDTCHTITIALQNDNGGATVGKTTLFQIIEPGEKKEMNIKIPIKSPFVNKQQSTTLRMISFSSKGFPILAKPLQSIVYYPPTRKPLQSIVYYPL